MENSRQFRPELIGVRRRMLGLSQSELSRETAISQATISKLEQGLRAPNEAQVQSLADALRCPVSFFFQNEREYGPPMSAHPVFRKKAAVGQKTMDRVIAEFNVRLAHTRVLLNNVEFEPELVLPSYDADDYEGHIEDVAEMVRRCWYVPRGPIASVMEYLERAGILIIPMSMESAKIDAASYRIPGLPPVIFLNKEMPGDRQRFTLAHELGHLVMHRFPTPSMEKQADEFAAAFLMPKDDIASQLKGLTLTKAAQLKPYWKASMAALIVRAKTLRKIDDGASAYLWRQMSIRGYRTREPKTIDVTAESPTLMPALLSNLTEEMGYSENDLEQALHLHYRELSDLYGFTAPKSSGLRLVK